MKAQKIIIIKEDLQYEMVDLINNIEDLSEEHLISMDIKYLVLKDEDYNQANIIQEEKINAIRSKNFQHAADCRDKELYLLRKINPYFQDSIQAFYKPGLTIHYQIDKRAKILKRLYEDK
jgi:hypothetical protein